MSDLYSFKNWVVTLGTPIGSEQEGGLTISKQSFAPNSEIDFGFMDPERVKYQEGVFGGLFVSETASVAGYARFVLSLGAKENPTLALYQKNRTRFPITLQYVNSNHKAGGPIGIITQSPPMKPTAQQTFIEWYILINGFYDNHASFPDFMELPELD